MGEEDPGVEAVRVMSGDHEVELLREILAELGAEGAADSSAGTISA